MALRDLQFKREYRSFRDDIVNEFYIPALKEAKLYQRAVGFFSSSALNLIASGIDCVCNNGGNVQVICSPKLSKEDIDEIGKGYERRKIIERALIREMKEPSTPEEEKNLSYIAKLIAEKYLDIKIAELVSDEEVAMYHEKVGIITDCEGDSLAFSGSMNESDTAFHKNYESFDVFCSWTNDEERVRDKKESFESIWADYEPGVRTYDFPRAAKEKILQYRTGFSNSDNLNSELSNEQEKDDKFFLPDWLKLRDYQIQAIEKWEEKNYHGIYDMATGTGKTLTALASAEYLYRKNNRRLAIIIVVPYQHLVTQWEEDIVGFGLKPVIGFSGSKQKDWKNRLFNEIFRFNFKEENVFCFITTNSMFCSDYVKTEIAKLKNDTLIIVDEAHNMGATSAQNYLPNNINFRLALSATIERHHDFLGTQMLFDYFGDRCIRYTLKEAIDNGMLTKYYYYPVIVTLNSNELDDYVELTSRITKCLKKKNGKLTLTESAKTLLIERSRIVAGAESKIDKLEHEIKPYKDKNHMLVYCGTTSANADMFEENSDTEISQIDCVCKMLGEKLGMRVGRFTSKETEKEREVIKEKFADGKMLQTLVAIKCLDEGVNIPSIKTAFILASSTNPKEYIQRRGRVLRKYPGKEYAEIYDFITLPCDTDDVDSLQDKTLNSTKGLVKKEIIRMMDFSEISENPSKAYEIILKLKTEFNITDNDLKGDEDAI